MQHVSHPRRLALTGLAALAGAVGVTQATAAPGPSAPTPQSPVAIVENVASQTPSVSADGRFIAYVGAPVTFGDLRPNTVLLRDREAGTITELTPPTDRIRAGASAWPVLSADGCTVTILTEQALDLFRDNDEGARWDVYRTVLAQCGGDGDWELVSATAGSGFETSAGDDVDPAYPPAVSGEGTIVAFTHRFSPVADDLTGITVVDLSVPIGDPGRSQPVAGSPAAAPATTFRYHGLREPALSRDGTILAYTSDAESSLALPQWGSGPRPGDFATSAVYVWNRLDADRNTAVRRVIPGSAPVESTSPALSGDGNVVAFVSPSTTLVPGAAYPACNPDCVPQVYLYDRTTGTMRLGSRVPGDPATAPVAVDAAASQPALSEAGDQLVYVTRATNLFPTRSGAVGGAGDGDVVLAVPASGTATRVNLRADGVTPAPAANSHPHLSASGRVVVFDTLAGAAYGEASINGRQVAVVDYTPVLHLADLDMGTVAVGFPGPEWYLVVANDGPGAFLPTAVEIDQPDFLISGGSCLDQPAAPVPPGGACTVNLMFMPSIEGAQEATLTVREDGFTGTAITSTLRGVGGEPALAPSPAGADGGELLVGQRGEPLTFTITNVAFNPVTIRSVKLQGTNPDDFSVNTDGCSGTKVDAGLTCEVTVLFSPTGAGRRTANLVVATTDGAYTTMLLSGDGHYDPRIATSASTIVAGSRVDVVGDGFAPLTQVTIAWADGRGRPVTVTTDYFGGLQATLVVMPNEPRGARTIVVQAADGSAASTGVVVVASTRGSTGPASPNWPGR